MRLTQDDWEALLDRGPSDRATRLAYADWLDEQGKGEPASAPW